MLCSFTCSRDVDVQSFLHTKALAYEKADISRTYLFWNGETARLISDIRIYAFFTITQKIFTFNESLSNSKRRNIAGFFYKSDEAVGYLIGQVGKNDAIPKQTNPVTLPDIIAAASQKIQTVHTHIGGRFMFLDCKAQNRKIYNKYLQYSFVPYQDITLDGTTYCQLVKLLHTT